MEDYYYTIDIPKTVYRNLNKSSWVNKHFSVSYVGNCMELMTDFYKHTEIRTHNGWENYYNNIVGFNNLTKIYDILEQRLDTKKEYIKKYIWHRVIGQTWNGFRNEIAVIDELQLEFPNTQIKKTSFEIDHEYCIDAEMYIGDFLLLGIQIKPVSYMSMNTAYQNRAKENHRKKNQQYKQKYAPYIYVYHKDHKIHRKQYVFDQINVISTLRKHF